MSPHDEVLHALLDGLAPRGGEIRLLGRLDDDVVGNPSDRDVYFFIPDLHLVSEATRRRFGDYGLNHRDSGLLQDLLARVATLRARWAERGRARLVTVQLGDLVDLWRELSGRVTAAAIPDDAFGRLRDLIYKGARRGRPSLGAAVMLGNHDIRRGVMMPDVPFFRHAVNRCSSGRPPFLYATHGDTLDALECFVPQALKELAVKAAGSFTPSTRYSIPTTRPTRARCPASRPAAPTVLDAASDTGAVRVMPNEPLPSRMVRELERPGACGRFGASYRSIDRYAATRPLARNLRTVVVGHTHRATLDVARPEGGRPMVLMDAGAWTDQCRYHRDNGDVTVEPNAQFGVIHRNDARLYQISVPA